MRQVQTKLSAVMSRAAIDEGGTVIDVIALGLDHYACSATPCRRGAVVPSDSRRFTQIAKERKLRRGGGAAAVS